MDAVGKYKTEPGTSYCIRKQRMVGTCHMDIAVRLNRKSGTIWISKQIMRMTNHIPVNKIGIQGKK